MWKALNGNQHNETHYNNTNAFSLCFLIFLGEICHPFNYNTEADVWLGGMKTSETDAHIFFNISLFA